MSFGWTAATWIAIGTAATSVYSTVTSRNANNRALRQQQAQAKSAQESADRAQNKANAKAPDVAGMLGAAGRASAGGQAGTLLTGPQGLDTTALTLGKSTLLGGGG